MSRLEEIKKVVESQKEAVRKLSHNDLNWLIKQAERVEVYELANEPISHKLANLNKFLQERNIGQWGESVIANVMNYVEKLEGEIEGLLQTLEDKEPYYSNLCLMLEKQNKRYEQALDFYARKYNYSYSPIDDNIPKVNLDGGETARKALNR